jgi:TolB protein
VSVAGDKQDLVMTNEKGGGIARLTQDQGSNTYPACSSDGRLLAFFSTRKSGKGPGMYVLSLKRWTTQKVSAQLGESLRWAPLP